MLYADDESKDFIANLFLPPPTLALMIHHNSNSKGTWTYIDLLEDRLHVMMPLLPGLVVSLVNEDESTGNEDKRRQVLSILEEMLGAVCGSFERVFGQWMQTHLEQVSLLTNSWTRKVGMGGPKLNPNDSPICKAAKDFIPQFVVVALWLEQHIRKTTTKKRNHSEPVVVYQQHTEPPKETPNDKSTEGEEDDKKVEASDSWIEVAGADSATDDVLDLHFQNTSSAIEDERKSQACLRSVLSTVTDLICHASKIGGGEWSTAIWRSVFRTLQENIETTKKTSNGNEEAKRLSNDILCRLAAIVLTKLQQKDSTEVAMWPFELCQAVARLVGLVEEKELLAAGVDGMSPDQILLECALLGILAYGREMTGWCQLLLPNPAQQKPRRRFSMDDNLISGTGSNDSADTATPQHFVPPDLPGASTKILLPILQPCVRIAYSTIPHIGSSQQVILPCKTGTPKKRGLLDMLLKELQESSVAAIVGLSLLNARDVALLALSTLRRAHQNSGDTAALESCSILFCGIVEEIRVRYEGERRPRENALLDAYEGRDRSRSPKPTRKKGEVEDIRFDSEDDEAGDGGSAEKDPQPLSTNVQNNT